MAMVPITVMGYKCERCRKEWIPGSLAEEPRECPQCHSTAWNRATGPLLTYESFASKIAATLKAGSPLTWTEIRTTAGLPQKFPNNGWVHRLEKDIGLLRQKDSHGIINWRLREADENATAA
jgi:hypothetical protein